jgi:hypothetical protein
LKGSGRPHFCDPSKNPVVFLVNFLIFSILFLIFWNTIDLAKNGGHGGTGGPKGT